MALVRRWLDTCSVARAAGPRAVARAVARRTAARLNAALHPWSARLDTTREEVDRFARALSRSSSPFVDDERALRLHILAREQPGACTRAIDRARDVAGDIEAQLGRRVSSSEDPRLAWEPARLQELVVLGIGARSTENMAEAEVLRLALVAGARAWIEAHPPEAKLGWESPLEVALRAWNLWLAVSLARPASLDETTLVLLARTFVQHARWVARAREDCGLVVGTHLVGAMVGLIACGVALAGAGDEPGRWRAHAGSVLAREAGRQILADGGGVEGSSGYARFAAELWIASVVAARAVGDAVPDSVETAAMKSLEWLAASMTPEGRDPGIGDDDDSSVLPPVRRDAKSVVGLVALGAALLHGDHRYDGVPFSEECAWLTGAAGYRRYCAARMRLLPPSFAAPDFGLHVARGEGSGDMVVLSAGGNGQGGVGGHAHNDVLALEVWLGGRPVVIDPGTGLYLGRPALRDRFRGVAAHATLCVDGLEPSPLLATRPFALPDRAAARARSGRDGDGVWRAAGRHAGYRQIGVEHRRNVVFDPRQRTIIVTDELDGAGWHDVVLSFPLGADEVALVEGAVRVGPERAPWAWLVAPADQLDPWRLEPGARSSRYGRVERGLVARRSLRMRLPVTLLSTLVAARGQQ